MKDPQWYAVQVSDTTMLLNVFIARTTKYSDETITRIYVKPSAGINASATAILYKKNVVT